MLGFKFKQESPFIQAVGLNLQDQVSTFLAVNPTLVNIPTSKHQLSPIMVAAIRGHQSMVQLLASHDADIDAQNEKGENLFAATVHYGKDPTILPAILKLYSDNKKVAQSEVFKNHVSQCCENNGYNLLMIAVEFGNIDMCQAIYSFIPENLRHSQLHHVTKNGATLLEIATKRNVIPIIQFVESLYDANELQHQKEIIKNKLVFKLPVATMPTKAIPLSSVTTHASQMPSTATASLPNKKKVCEDFQTRWTRILSERKSNRVMAAARNELLPNGLFYTQEQLEKIKIYFADNNHHKMLGNSEFPHSIIKDENGILYTIYLGGKLGKGAFGKVKLAQNMSNKEFCVVKVYKNLSEAEYEIQFLSLKNRLLGFQQIVERKDPTSL